MARTRQFDERQALVSAMLVFWEKGYEGTSISDLESAMGLKRTSIYNAFGNKRKVFGRILARYRDSVMLDLLARMDSAPDIRTGVRRLLNGALDHHFDDDNPGGCLVVLSLVEMEQHDAETKAGLEEILQGLKQGLQARLNAAKEKGELAADLDAGITATTITSIMSGMMVLCKANFSRATMKKTVNQAVSLLG